jgi:hypothetical protein
LYLERKKKKVNFFLLTHGLFFLHSSHIIFVKATAYIQVYTPTTSACIVEKAFAFSMHAAHSTRWCTNGAAVSPCNTKARELPLPSSKTTNPHRVSFMNCLRLLRNHNNPPCFSNTRISRQYISSASVSQAFLRIPVPLLAQGVNQQRKQQNFSTCINDKDGNENSVTAVKQASSVHSTIAAVACELRLESKCASPFPTPLLTKTSCDAKHKQQYTSEISGSGPYITRKTSEDFFCPFFLMPVVVNVFCEHPKFALCSRRVRTIAKYTHHRGHAHARWELATANRAGHDLTARTDAFFAVFFAYLYTCAGHQAARDDVFCCSFPREGRIHVRSVFDETAKAFNSKLL